jgi:hypothetical protein
MFGHGAICSPVARGHHIGWSAGSARRPDAAAHRQKPARAERLHVLHRSRTVPWHGQIDLVEPFSGSTRSRLDPDIEKRCRTPQRRARSRHQCAVSKIVEDDCGIFGVGATNARDGLALANPSHGLAIDGYRGVYHRVRGLFALSIPHIAAPVIGRVFARPVGSCGLLAGIECTREGQIGLR